MKKLCDLRWAMSNNQPTAEHQNLISNSINTDQLDPLEDDQSSSSTGRF